MIEKAIEQIGKEDIDLLITNGVPEGRDIEYKAKLPGKARCEHEEFLHDVAAFANAAGGHLFYGIVERDGVAEAAPGLGGISVDAETLRLENCLRDGVDPRIPGVQIRAVDGFADGPVLIVRVPQSWRSPHMVKGTYRFCSRSSNGKYQMDTTELRSAFAMSEGLAERIRRFRDERLARIVAGETPVWLMEEAKVVLHVVPLSAMGSRVEGIDLTGKSHQLVRMFPPIYGGGGDYRYNIDGFVTSHPSGKDGSGSFGYCQLFRNGAVEAVFAGIMGPEKSGRRWIRIKVIEREVTGAVKTYLGGLQALNVAAPFEVMVSMLGVKGAEIEGDDFPPPCHPTPIDRDMLLLPDALVEEHDVDVRTMLRPIFDAVWNAAGYEKSLTFDDKG